MWATSMKVPESPQSPAQIFPVTRPACDVQISLGASSMNLKRFWPPEAHHRVMVLLSTAAVVIVVAHIFLPKALLDKAEIDIPLVTLVLLALYVLAYVGNEAEESGLRHAAELGLKEVFSSRLEAGQSDEYSDLLENAKSELFVVGVTLKDLTSDVGGVLRERVRKGCRVELLILSPEFRDNNPPPIDQSPSRIAIPP